MSVIVSFRFQINKTDEVVIYQSEMDFKKSFCWGSTLRLGLRLLALIYV